jgi:hypothetical protein
VSTPYLLTSLSCFNSSSQGRESARNTESCVASCAQNRRREARCLSVIAKDKQWRGFGTQPVHLLAKLDSQVRPVHGQGIWVLKNISGLLRQVLERAALRPANVSGFIILALSEIQNGCFRESGSFTGEFAPAGLPVIGSTDALCSLFPRQHAEGLFWAQLPAHVVFIQNAGE